MSHIRRRARQKTGGDGPPTTDTQAGPALRVDAERNRERIVTAAQELFTTRGIDTPLEDVAAHADVGVATLYRRFPTRADLVQAVYERKIAAYITAVERAVGAADAWVGFSGLVYDLCELQAADAGLKDLLTLRFPGSTVVENLQTQAERDVLALIDRAQRQGALRTDFDLNDILVLLLANGGIVTATRDAAPIVSRRFAAYMLQAFGTGLSQPLPAAATQDQLLRPVDG